MRSLYKRLVLGVWLSLAGSWPLLACQATAGAPRGPSVASKSEAPSTPEVSAEHAAAAATLADPAASAAKLLRVSRQSAATRAERDHFLYLPAGHALDPDARWPVILFLHGDGSRGDAKGELDYVMRNGPLYEAWVQKRELPFIIIAPQLPTFGRESKVDFLKNRTRTDIPVRLEAGVPDRPAETATPEPMAGAVGEPLPDGATGYGPEQGWPELEADVLAILDDVLTSRQGDPTRVYLTGLSYGGFGTWYLASKHPERFAAIVPIVGYGHPELMPAIASAGLPVWCFAGGRDAAVRVKNFYAGLNRLESLGAREVRFTIEEDMGHDVWARVYAGRDIYDWMLAHTRPDAASSASAASTSAPR